MSSGHCLELGGSSVGPWQEFIDGAIGMADDLGEHVGEIGVWIDAAQLAILDKGSDDSPAFPAAIRSGEERVLAVEGDGSD
jgi:hypothetical protein